MANRRRKNVGFADDYDPLDPNDGLLKQRIGFDGPAHAIKPHNISSHTPEVISRQATMNVVVAGPLGSGVTSFVKKITSRDEVSSSSPRSMKPEIQYANAKIYKCSDPSVPRPECYRAFGSRSKDTHVYKNTVYNLKRHVSFLTFPNHCVLISSLLTGIDVDVMIIVVDANSLFTHTKIRDILFACTKVGLKQVIILQNKIDIVEKSRTKEHQEDILNCLQMGGFGLGEVPIIPISVAKELNIDVVVDILATQMQTKKRDYTLPGRMQILKSLDSNPENCEVSELKGGVLGTQIMQGWFKVGQSVEIRPGVLYKRLHGIECMPIRTKITEMFAEANSLQVAITGGMHGLVTSMDPSLAQRNRLQGQIVGVPPHVPEIWLSVKAEVELFSHTIRMNPPEQNADDLVSSTYSNVPPAKLYKGEAIMLYLGTAVVLSRVRTSDTDICTFIFKHPMCCSIDQTFTLLRQTRTKDWSLIGCARMVEGVGKCPIFSKPPANVDNDV